MDNMGDMDFDLEPGNVDMKMTGDPSVKGEENED
jgi:hypothetical protein